MINMQSFLNATRLILGSLAVFIGLCSSAHSQTSASICGDLANGFGPFDYRKYAGTAEWNRHQTNDQNNPLYLVHSAHFRPEMEALSHGGQGPKSDVGPELDYTLRAFPNHHRALDAMVRLSERLKMDAPRGARYNVECWFDRALRFQPDDPIARMIFTNFLIKKNRKPEAMQQLETVLKLAKDNAFTHHNVGLLYFDLGEHQLALTQAHKSIELGLNRPNLREKLQSIGQWTEPTPAQAESDPAKP